LSRRWAADRILGRLDRQRATARRHAPQPTRQEHHMSRPRTRVWLDCDTGSDDAIAILSAALHPGLELLGVSCVNGNVTLDHVVDNTLRTLTLAGVRVPVHRGAARPLVRPDF